MDVDIYCEPERISKNIAGTSTVGSTREVEAGRPNYTRQGDWGTLKILVLVILYVIVQQRDENFNMYHSNV